MLEERSVLLVKEETEYGTDPTPSSTANAVLAIGAKVKEVHEPAERGPQSKSLSPNASLLGSLYAEISFSLEVKGSGTKGVAPRLGALLKACAHSEGAVAGSSVSYKPTSASIVSVTLYLYKDGRLHIVKGARGTAKLKNSANKVATLEFSLKGLYAAPTDTVLPTTVTYESTEPPICKNQTISFNSVTSLEMESSELDFAVEAAALPSKTATNGIGSIQITSRKPTITINPQSVPISTLDLRALRGVTPVAYSEVLGSVAGNKITISVPKFNVIDIEYADREKVTVENIKGECVRNTDAGDDEYEIKFE